MIRSIRLSGARIVAGLLLVLLGACASPRSGPTVPASTSDPATASEQPAVTPAQPAGAVPSEAASPDAGQPQEATPESDKPAAAESEEDAAEKAEKKARDRQRKLEKLERNMEVAQLSLAKASIALELGALRQNDSLANAEKSHELAMRELEIFRKFMRPNRLARAELNLRGAEDRLTETREELQQLELMYAEDQFADQTKEIVLERARRRLEHSERDLELRREELVTLREITLPLEEMKLDFEAEKKMLAVLQTQRDDEGPGLDRRIAVLDAESKAIELDNELEDVRAEIAKAADEDKPGEGLDQVIEQLNKAREPLRERDDWLDRLNELIEELERARGDKSTDPAS